MNQQVSPCYHSFLAVTQRYNSKVTPIRELHAEKIAEAVLLYVFRIAFPASLLLRFIYKTILIRFFLGLPGPSSEDMW